MVESILYALRNELLTRGPLDTLPDPVWKRMGALNTWGTNAIEGNTLTWSDVQKLLLERRSVADRPLSDVLETIQHEAAFRALVDRRGFPIRTTTALELHEAVFRGIKPDAGQWRRVNVRIAGMAHVPPRVEKVASRMTAWEEAYTARDTAGEPVFSLGAWMHFEFESIHPFSDGNGRAGRLLLNLHFLKHDWPPLHILPPDRDRYLRCLVRAHADGPVELERFLREAMARSLLDLLDQVGVREDELKPLKSFERRGPYSTKYLALRANQGELPALKVAGDWRTSPRALRLYRELTGRRPER